MNLKTTNGNGNIEIENGKYVFLKQSKVLRGRKILLKTKKNNTKLPYHIDLPLREYWKMYLKSKKRLKMR